MHVLPGRDIVSAVCPWTPAAAWLAPPAAGLPVSYPAISISTNSSTSSTLTFFFHWQISPSSPHTHTCWNIFVHTQQNTLPKSSIVLHFVNFQKWISMLQFTHTVTQPFVKISFNKCTTESENCHCSTSNSLTAWCERIKLASDTLLRTVRVLAMVLNSCLELVKGTFWRACVL